MLWDKVVKVVFNYSLIHEVDNHKVNSDCIK